MIPLCRNEASIHALICHHAHSVGNSSFEVLSAASGARQLAMIVIMNELSSV